ncbi:MAG TPA: phenylacetate--CoA ligase family protein [Ktedonobacteraceae bacterium]
MNNTKSTIPSSVSFLSASWEAWKAAREGEAGIAQRQRRRLRTLVRYARAHSAYFATRYHCVPGHLTDVRQLPVITKAEMMAHFDGWVTDPLVTREQVEAFIADPALIGHDYRDRYVVCTTSGSTGTPAILLHDRGALTIYNVLGYIRSLPVVLLSLRHLGALLRGRGRLAAIFVTQGHFLGNTMMARRVRAMPWRARTQRIFSALTPLPLLVQNLNSFQPVILGGYPSVLEILAKEQQAGRLHIHPIQISAAGETLTGTTRQRITTAFGVAVSNYYGSSEAVGLTFECKQHRLHVNSDWYILEPVDEDDQPVPPGQLSHAVLVTNLANRVQPIIRYKMGDRVAISPNVCPCGSPFPVIHVIGRTDDILTFPASGGGEVQILPLSIVTIAEETPGIVSCQLIQTELLKLMVRFSVQKTGEEPEVWKALQTRLRAYLAEQGIVNVMIEKAQEPPQLHPKSGKFRQVWSEVTQQ